MPSSTSKIGIAEVHPHKMKVNHDSTRKVKHSGNKSTSFR